ncbi:hypothetical protein [Acinetobacter baumannii]|uniref:hypothetical protein n=1 Tax=Acinetobacter baumannii TaxID=470 RepID=UPI001FFE48A9|nr:hypothetical protein [Acinetobacter baumannii]
MRFDLSQIFDTKILKNMKYKLINHSKKIEAVYEFEQESSARVYSDSVDNVELALVPGAYLTEIKELMLGQEAESLDGEEIDGCGCGLDHEHTSYAEHNDLPVAAHIFNDCIFALDNLFLDEAHKKINSKSSKK